jgi:pimeloyl-ACP methyl ester carboxylesterase
VRSVSDRSRQSGLAQHKSGVAFSDEDADVRWAQFFRDRSNPQPGQTSFLHPDVDGPAASASIDIFYEDRPVAAAQQLATPHLLNDFAVIMIYGRFYAGGSLRQDIADMQAGMWLVAQRLEIDVARVAIIGGSWGGFEALYANAYGDAGITPLITVAMYPPADFRLMQPHFRSRTGLAETYLRPYVNRINASTGGDPDAAGVHYDGLDFNSLCAAGSSTKLRGEILVLHDENDNLVPVSQSRQLQAQCGAKAVYWPRADPLDSSAFSHGKILDTAAEPGVLSASTYANSYLHLALARSDQPSVFHFYQAQSMQNHLSLVHAAQVAGKDVSWAAPRLRELCDPRLLLLDLQLQSVTGPQMVATAVNAVWATNDTPSAVCTRLSTGLPGTL